MQQAVFHVGAGHLDVIGKLEDALEGARGNALIKNIACLFFLDLFLAGDGECVFLHRDRKVVFAKAGDSNRDPVGIFAGPLDIIGRITRRGAVKSLIDQGEEAVEADGRTV